MDFAGQKLCEQIYQIILILFGVLGLIVGAIKQDFLYTVYGVAAGGIVASLVCLPDWSFYNKHPITWLTPGDESKETENDKERKKSLNKKK